MSTTATNALPCDFVYTPTTTIAPATTAVPCWPTYPVGDGLIGGSSTTFNGFAFATEAQVRALEAENKRLRARMKRLEKLVAAALIRVEDDE